MKTAEYFEVLESGLAEAMEIAGKARSQGKPWYTAYFSLPGILIILALLLPVIIRVINE